jgi:predicted transcriptional regulator
VKRYEFRRRAFGGNVEKVFVYSTAPIKKIVAEFSVKSIIKDNPKALWFDFKEFSGLEETEFFEYFDGAEKGYAIEVSKLRTLEPIDPKNLVPTFRPPQSYCYISKRIAKKIENQTSFLWKK